ADDFVAAVKAYTRPFGDSEGEGFTTERVGGVVVAKNLAQAADESRIAIVFSAALWASQGEASRFAIVAHEIAHSLMSRVRQLSGALDGVLFPSLTLTEVARSSARIDWDEFRAEAMADEFLRAMATADTEGGESRPARLADLTLALSLKTAKDELGDAY